MREIVSVQLGQCGNQLGTKFFKLISAEHGLSSDGVYEAPPDGGSSTETDQLQHISTYFSEREKGGGYRARAVLVDTDTDSLAKVKASPISRLFRSKNYVSGQSKGGLNRLFAAGHLTEAGDVLEPTLDAVRREAEASDCFQAVQLCHSMGGGTGAGVGTKLIEELRMEYIIEPQATFSVVPSLKVAGTSPIETYNAVLCLHHLIENSDCNVLLDNQSLQRICQQQQQPGSFGDLNHVAATTMSGVTSSFRLPGRLNSTPRKLLLNMVSFPRLHFPICSFAPHTARGASATRQSAGQLTEAMLSASNCLVDCEPQQGVYLDLNAIYRGTFDQHELGDELACLHRPSAQKRFCEWLPLNCHNAVYATPVAGVPASATLLAQNTAVCDVFKRLQHDFHALFEHNSYLHYFENEGMDIMELTEAEANLSDLIMEYEQYEKADASTRDPERATPSPPPYTDTDTEPEPPLYTDTEPQPPPQPHRAATRSRYCALV